MWKKIAWIDNAYTILFFVHINSSANLIIRMSNTIVQKFTKQPCVILLCFFSKPYTQAIRQAPQFESSLMALSCECIPAILPFLHNYTTEDAFHDMITCYFESIQNSSKNAITQTRKIITDKIKEQNRIRSILYNPYRNISLDHPLGNSNTPVSDWMNVSKWKEWDD